MIVQVVKPYNSYAMNQMADPFGLPTIPQPEPGADLTLHIPWHTLVGLDKNKYNGKHVMFYTHTNATMEHQLVDAVTRADAVVCMSEKGVDEIKALGTRFKPVHCAYMPINPAYTPKKIVIGVVGAEQPNGRKGSHKLLELAFSMNLYPFHFIIIGTGWEDTVKKLKNNSVTVSYYEKVDSVDYSEMDLLLCTGEVEGGPLPLVEALACGVRVIAPNYGLAHDLLDKEDKYDSILELVTILEKIAKQKMRRVQLVSGMGTDNYVQTVEGLVNRLMGIEPDSRYEWVNRIVAETGAQRLMEVGTWNGDRAIGMIHTAQEKNEDVSYVGFDLFEQFTDADNKLEFSKKPLPSDIVYRKIANTGANVNLSMGNTRTTMTKQLYPQQDFIYIDGGHSWETIQSDWDNVQKYMHDKTVVLFDDYYYNKEDEVKGIGCQKLIHELLDSGKYEVTMLGPVEEWPQVWGMLKVAMVKVSKNNA